VEQSQRPLIQRIFLLFFIWTNRVFSIIFTICGGQDVTRSNAFSFIEGNDIPYIQQLAPTGQFLRDIHQAITNSRNRDLIQKSQWDA
jgi:hypothetical protein